MKFIPGFWSLYFFSKQGFFHVIFHVLRSLVFIGFIFAMLVFVIMLILVGIINNIPIQVLTSYIAHNVVILIFMYLILRWIFGIIWSFIRSMFS